MSDSSESDDGPSRWNRHRRGNGKNNRKIVMRIEFDDSNDTSSCSESQNENEEEAVRPSARGLRGRGGGKRLISSDEDSCSSGSEIVRTVVRRGGNKRKAVIIEEDPPVDEPHTSTAVQNTPSSSGNAQVPLLGEDGFASDSSNDDLEKCPICLLSLRNQEIGKPSVCDHLFCAICIEEWSRNVRTCPIDRQAFDSIVVQRSISNREFVRLIQVEETKKAEFEDEVEEIFEDPVATELEHCQICHRPDREDVMLLCDGCNHGYHMDCLSNPLTQIPDGFWYCDNCFQSEEEDIQENLNELYEDLREMGIPETRLRVREIRQPRIPRTRQSERIRASIMARTRRSSTRITTEMDFAQPESSNNLRAATSSRSTASASRSRTTRKRRSRRRTGRQRRTYVVEYDVDNFDQKFEIKTTKRVIRKKKSSKRGKRRGRRKATVRTTGTHQRNVELQEYISQRAARESGSSLPQPRFSIFGAANDLEYFSDESENSAAGGDPEVGRGSGGGAAIQTSIRIHSFSSSRSHSRRKALIRDLDQPRQVDLLSSIMDMQDRFHNATRQNHINQVTIGPDGTLNLPSKKDGEGEKKKGDQKENKNVSPSDVNQAPMYPRGGGNNYTNTGGTSGGGGGGGGYNNRFNNQSNYRNSTGGGGGGNGGQFRSGSSGGSGNGSSGGFLFNAFRRDNNFSSDGNFLQNRLNNADNNNSNRDRFRQNQNQQQRQNQNNQNRFSGSSSLGSSNDSFNRSLGDISSSSLRDSNSNRPQTSLLFSIGPISLFDTPTKSDSVGQSSSTPSSLGPSSGLSSLSLRSGGNFLSIPAKPNDNLTTPGNFNSAPSAMPMNSGNFLSTPAKSFTTDLSAPPPSTPMSLPPPSNPLSVPPPSTPLSVPPPGTPMSLPPPSAPMSVPPPSTPISVPPLINPMSALLPSAPINYSMSNVAIPMTTGSNFLPMHQPPPPVLPVYGPMNLPALDSAPPPTVGISHQTNTNEAPMPDVAPAVPPLAPPPWNSNLFRLTSDYADSNDDEDNDSDCPNFSVYSAESFQVARSSETTSGGVASSTSKKDSNNSNRQEDEFEEKEEDLVQLGDDDEIPDALEKGNAKNAENNDGIGGNKIVPESEIYEPEFPTFEAQDDDDEENDENDNEAENDEHNENSKDNDETVKKINEQVESDENECMQSSKDESKVEEDAESMDIAETDEDSGEHTAEVEKKDNENEMASVKDDGDKESEKLEKEEEKGAEASREEDAKIDGNTNETTDVENESEVTQDKLDELKKKAPRPRKKGILELYDDSDWEEWNIDKAELIPMPPGPEPEPKIIDEVASIDGESPTKKDDEDMQNIVEGDKGNFDEQSQQEESLNNEEEHDGEEISMTPEKLPRSPDEGGTPEIDEAKLRQLKTKKVDTGSEDDEQERSYTPCLDEKTELEEGECQENANSDSGEKGKMDETRGDVSTSVVDGMEMEMISEEDEGVLSEDHQKGYGGRGNEKNKRDEGKRSKKEQFKKISKSTKERNYRDKENRNRGRKRNNSRLRSRSRSFSRGKENRNRQRPAFRRNRRKEIERYNVRNVIGQPRTYKDRYGRDTSRPPRSRSRSRSFRRLRSKSRTRSPSPKHDRRSFSMSPTPMSPRRTSARRILSPQRRISPRRRRGFSPRRSRSRSRRRSHSIRRSSLPRRRSRSPIRLRSRSRSASVARGIRRNQRPKRRASSYSCSGSCSRSHSKLGSRSRSRSPGPKSPRRSRSKTPVRQKKLRKRSKDRKKKRSKKRVLSMSPSPARSKRGARSPERLPALARKKKKRARTKTPVIEEERWSQSPRPAQDTLSNAPNDPSWTPPLIGTNNDNLTVILKNKDAAANANRKKRDKKKKGEKRRENVSKKDKRRQRSEMRDSPVAPSKEVFASGNNILVSVSFNKENNANAPQQTTVVTLPPTREEILSRRSAERHVRRVKKSREKARRRKKIDTKPIAIIDLDRSPFQVIAQSPRDVIILTDESDREPDDDAHQHNESVNSMEMGANDRNVADMHVDDIEKTIEAQRPGMMEEEHEHFEIQQLGPKTPPDPPSTVKFSLPKGKQMKARNPLHEEQEELQEQVESEHPDDQMQMPTTNKIGPNTPPESGPCSPDAYDPFDPTKSPSLSPAHSPAPPQTNEEEDTNEKISHSQEANTVESRPVAIVQEKTMNPVELVMALINSKAAMSQQDMINLNNDATAYTISKKSDGTEINVGVDENNASGKNITVLSSVLISSGKPQTRPNQVLSTSPPKLPTSRQNGGTGAPNDDIAFAGDPESPYSPDSGDFDDLFEPPPPDNSISLAQLAHNRKSNKADIFDNLFGSTSPGGQVRMPSFSRRKGNKSKRTRVAKTNDDQVKIFDELPSSAVELQVKDKFLRKLNRQERVVEEVKLVLKPHYNRKRISKEDYKEILRRSVPKICHSRSGEINPAKIKNLIEAYVKKFRQRNKLNMIGTGQVSSAVKCAAYLKKL